MQPRGGRNAEPEGPAAVREGQELLRLFLTGGLPAAAADAGGAGKQDAAALVSENVIHTAAHYCCRNNHGWTLHEGCPDQCRQRTSSCSCKE